MTRYLLDGDEEIAELSDSGVVLRRYIMGPAIDDRIATAEGSSTTSPTKTYYHTNHQGSVIAMADAAGNATGCAAGVNCQRLSYDEYGRLGAGSVTTGQPYRYTGRRFDEETKLYYYRARYYSPELGRFLQTDPIGYEDDVNLYAYVGNNPVNAVDPDGRAAFLIPLAIIAYRAYSAYDTVSSTIDNAKTITSDTASTTDKVLAVVDTAANVGCGNVCGKVSDAVAPIVEKATKKVGGIFGGMTRKEAYGNPSSSKAAKEAREAGEGQPCPTCGKTMEKGTDTEPWAQHDPTLGDHFNDGPGKGQTPAERRAHARSPDSINGAKCKTCQQNEGRGMQKKYRGDEE